MVSSGPIRPAPVDERDLAEAGGTVVASGELTQQLGTAVGVDLDRAPALEAHAQPGDGSAADEQRLGRAHDALGSLEGRGS